MDSISLAFKHSMQDRFPRVCDLPNRVCRDELCKNINSTVAYLSFVEAEIDAAILAS